MDPDIVGLLAQPDQAGKEMSIPVQSTGNFSMGVSQESRKKDYEYTQDEGCIGKTYGGFSLFHRIVSIQNIHQIDASKGSNES